MPWARIDDGFDDHPKVLALLEHDDGVAAIGLWTLCLTWAHRNTRKAGKVPGRIPSGLPRRYMGVMASGAAKLLVEERLWEVTDDGWQIHDFDKYLPTTETSAARSDAGKKGAEARWGKKRRDGKLPSGDMANDGTRMAGDGDTSPFEGDDADSDSPDGDGYDADGNLPSDDGTEPSEDGKPLASDGSRAPARRAISKEIAPVPGSQTQTRKTKDIVPAKPPRDDAQRLCEHLAERMVGNGCKRPTITQEWLNSARLLIDRDGRTEDQIHAAIDWCQDDEFWRANIRSMPKLREQYDQLRLQAMRDQAPRVSRKQQETDEMFERAMERARQREAREAAGNDPH